MDQYPLPSSGGWETSHRSFCQQQTTVHPSLCSNLKMASSWAAAQDGKRLYRIEAPGRIQQFLSSVTCMGAQPDLGVHSPPGETHQGLISRLAATALIFKKWVLEIFFFNWLHRCDVCLRYELSSTEKVPIQPGNGFIHKQPAEDWFRHTSALPHQVLLGPVGTHGNLGRGWCAYWNEQHVVRFFSPFNLIYKIRSQIYSCSCLTYRILESWQNWTPTVDVIKGFQYSRSWDRLTVLLTGDKLAVKSFLKIYIDV